MNQDDDAAKFMALLSKLHASNQVRVSLQKMAGDDGERSPMLVTLRIDPVTPRSKGAVRGRYH